MKIAILVQLFPPKWLGGMEIAAFNIAKILAKNGHNVNVITTADSKIREKKEEEGFTINKIPQLRLKFFGIIIFWLKILFLLKKIDPQIIHVQSIALGIPALLAKKFFKKPYIVYCRGSDVNLSWRRISLIPKLVLKNADRVIALTEDMRGKIKNIYGKDSEIIPNGIDTEKFTNLSKDEVRNKLGIKKDEKIIIFVGTLKFVKGIQYLVEAMKIISKNNPEAKLILIGDGDERENLKKFVESLGLVGCINFLGRKPNEEIPEYMVASDIFVLPSLSEGFTVTILEAMASGLPIVATNVSGLPEITKEGENGFLVEPKNSQQLAEKILFLFQDDNLRKKISENNLKKAQNYSWSKVVKSLESVYNRFITK